MLSTGRPDQTAHGVTMRTSANKQSAMVRIGDYWRAVGARQDRSGWRGHALAFCGYLACSLLMLAPLLPHFGDAIPGGLIAATDGWQNVWSIWWVQRAIAAGTDPFYTTAIFHPHGVPLHLQPLNASNGALVAPITALWGPIAGYNAAALLAFALAGMGGYALALHVSGHRVAAFVGGLIFTFSPFHLTKLWDGQLELAAIQWLAFYLLCLVRAIEGRRGRDALLAGLLLALVGYTSWYYFLFAVVSSGLVGLLWTLPHWRWGQVQPLLRQAAIVGAVSGAALAPVLLPGLAAAADAGQNLRPRDWAETIAYSANLLDFWLPSYLHPLWGEPIFTWLGPTLHPLSGDWNAALGYTTLGLALLAGLTAWRASWRWWVVTGAALLLALGPQLRIGGIQTDMALPYDLLLRLPGVEFGRRPGLFVVVATLALAPLSALGLRALLERAGPRRRLALAIILALLAVEYWPPAWPLHDGAVHPAYTVLRGGDGAVLTIPPPNYKRIDPQRAQMVHERPIPGGYLARSPDYPLARYVPGVRQLWNLDPADFPTIGSQPDDPLQALNAYGIRTIAVDWRLLDTQQRADLETLLARIAPGNMLTYADAALRIYSVPEVAPRPLLAFADGWHPEESDGGTHWRWMGETGSILLVNPAASTKPVRLDLRLASYQQAQTLELHLGRQRLARLEAMPLPTGIRLYLLLPPGEHRLHLNATALPEIGGNRRLSIVLLDAALR